MCATALIVETEVNDNSKLLNSPMILVALKIFAVDKLMNWTARAEFGLKIMRKANACNNLENGLDLGNLQRVKMDKIKLKIM